MNAIHKTILPAVALALISTIASAAGAPVLTEKIAHGANDLQRAAWSCENGAPSLAKGPTAGQQRFFLGIVDDIANPKNQSQLTLQGNRLSGFGNLSNDRGWSNIHFECTLRNDLLQATAFTFDTISPVSQDNKTPPSGILKAPDGDKMRWYVEGDSPVWLIHGIKETDNRDFRASCVKGAGDIKVALTRTMPSLKAGGNVVVSVNNGPDSNLYIASGVLDDNDGAIMPVFTAGAKDPLPNALSHGTSLLINIGANVVYSISLKGSPAVVKAFAAACRH